MKRPKNKFFSIQKILLTITVFSTCLSYSQYAKSLDVTAGIADSGYGAEIAYNHYNYRMNYFQAFASFEFDELIYNQFEVPYMFGGIGFGYFMPIAMDRREQFMVSMGGGGIVGYEFINEGKKELPNGALIKSEEGIIFGLFAGVEFENRITQGIKLVVKAKQQYRINSDLGNFSTYAGIGVRINQYR